MIEQVVVQITLGIHAGIAAKLFHTSTKYDNHAFIKYKKKSASMANASQVLALGVMYQEEVTLIVDGEKEKEHMEELISILTVE